MTHMIRFITAEIRFACVGLEFALKRTGKSRPAQWTVGPARKAIVLNRRLFFISFVVCYSGLSEYHVSGTSIKTEKPGFGYHRAFTVTLPASAGPKHTRLTPNFGYA